MNNNTAQAIRAAIIRGMDQDIRNIRVHDVIAEILSSKFTAKKITARLETLIKAAHPDWTVHYSPAGDLGQCYVYVWGGDSGYPSYDKRGQFFIGYTKDLEVYDATKFEERDARHGKAAVERNAKRSVQLGSVMWINNVATAIDNLNKAKAAFKEVNDSNGSFNIPDWYEIAKLVE